MVGASELWGWPDCSPTLAPLPEAQQAHGPWGHLGTAQYNYILYEGSLLRYTKRRLNGSAAHGQAHRAHGMLEETMVSSLLVS